MKSLLPWQVIGMNIAALGTSISFAKFIFLPHETKGNSNVKFGFWAAMVLLLGGLIIANGIYYEAYTIKNTIKPLLTIFAGWLAYLFIFQKAAIKLTRIPEEFDHLMGVMILMLMFLFWLVLAPGIREVIG